MKKVLSIFLAFALAFGLSPICAKAQDMSSYIEDAYIQFDNGTTTVRVGEKVKVIVTIVLTGGTKQVLNDTDEFNNLTFNTPTNVELTKEGENAYVKGLTVGDSTITFHYGAPDSNINPTTNITVNDLTLKPSYNHLYMLKNMTRRVTVKADWSNLIDVNDVTQSCTFSSTNPAVAVVNQSPVNPTVDGSSANEIGRIYPVSAGSTIIEVTYSGKTIQIPVSVMQLTIGSQSGALITETGGTATYVVTGIGMYDGAPLEVHWCTQNGDSDLAPPTGLTASGANLANNTSSITVNANSTVPSGTYYFKLFSNIETSIYSDNIASVTVAPDTRSSAKSITNFSIGSNTVGIDEPNHKISVTVPYGTDVTSLKPTIAVSAKATVSPASGVTHDFTSSATYTVTAENGTTQNYTVTVTKAPASSENAITGFSIGENAGVIDEPNHKITVTVPYGTNVSSMSPTITASAKTTVTPSGTAQNFTSPVIYTVTAENGTTQDYTVTVNVAKNSAKAITGFTIGGNTVAIDEPNHKISVTVPYGTDVTSLKPTIAVSAKATVSPSSGTEQNFTSPVNYTVTADDGAKQDYTVTVTVAKNSAKAITGFSIGSNTVGIDEPNHKISVTVPYGTEVSSLTPTITVSAKATVSPSSGTEQNFTSPVNYTVTADDGAKQDYTVTVTVAKNSAKAITGFSIGSNTVGIDEPNHKISVTVPYGTEVSSLTPTITVSAKATVSPSSGTEQNFTSPVNYTVTADDGAKQTYSVTVTVAKNGAKSITTPTAITGLTNGTAKTASALGLPSTVTLVTDNGDVSASVAWNVASCSYDSSSSSAQTFTVSGAVTLPSDIVNTNGVSLTTSISVTVNAASGSSGGTSSGGSSSGGSTTGNSSSVTVTTEAGTTTAAQTVSATTRSNGVAAASVTKDQITDMMKAASEKAQAQNTQTALEIKVDSGSAATGVSVTIPQGAASSLTNGVDALTISSPTVTVTFDNKALAEINKDTTGDITVTARKPADTALSDEDKAIIGNRPVYDLKVTSGSTTISTFGGGTATVSVPYTLTAGEDTSKIVVYYISGSGELVMVPGCVYDAYTGKVTFKTTHFSNYAVAYNDISFNDVSGWYADNVNYLAAREIVGGTGNGKFSPDANITRAQFVTILGRMSGDNLSGYTSSAFSDVGTNDWYFAAVAWAYENGIASGFDGAFDPNANITREQMAVMLYRYAKYAGAEVSNVKGMSIREFTDYSSISSYALTSIQWAINNSIVSGNSNGSFAPQANATRAQAARMIAILLQGTMK